MDNPVLAIPWSVGIPAQRGGIKRQAEAVKTEISEEKEKQRLAKGGKRKKKATQGKKAKKKKGENVKKSVTKDVKNGVQINDGKKSATKDVKNGAQSNDGKKSVTKDVKNGAQSKYMQEALLKEDVVPKVGGDHLNIPRKLPGHPDLGSLRLVLGTCKSYITCSDQTPHLLTELTEGQVGPLHKVLMCKIMTAASKHLLTKFEIKDLRDKLKMKFAQTD